MKKIWLCLVVAVSACGAGSEETEQMMVAPPMEELPMAGTAAPDPAPVAGAPTIEPSDPADPALPEAGSAAPVSTVTEVTVEGEQSVDDIRWETGTHIGRVTSACPVTLLLIEMQIVGLRTALREQCDVPVVIDFGEIFVDGMAILLPFPSIPSVTTNTAAYATALEPRFISDYSQTGGEITLSATYLPSGPIRFSGSIALAGSARPPQKMWLDNLRITTAFPQ